MRIFLLAVLCAALCGCGEKFPKGPFETAEEAAWKTANRSHTGEDGLFVQATWRTFAYEIAQLYAEAERQDLVQDQLNSRLRQLIYTFVDAQYPAEDGTDINNLYIQYLLYVNRDFDAANAIAKSKFDNWRSQYVRRVVDAVHDFKYPLLRQEYDERWGLTLYSRLVFYILVDNSESDLETRVDDLAARTFLVDEDGQRYRPSGMAGFYPYNYDKPKERTLDGRVIYRVFFPNRKADRKTPIITKDSRYLQLEIEGLGAETRKMRWDLPLEFPQVEVRRLASAPALSPPAP
jgi:hypothetical protein